MDTSTLYSRILPSELDASPVAKRIGLIALATDHTSELDFARICDPEEVGVYVARITYDNPTTPESLKRTGPRITEAASLILPDEQIDVIAYGCTAATVVLGDKTVADCIQKAKPGSKCVTPTSAAFAAFEALGVKKVSVLTPYSPLVTEELTAYFTSNGLDVVNWNCFGLDDDRNMARVSHSSIIASSAETIDEDADALFISCTAVRAAVCVDEIERITGKPVVTSNQAVVWRSLRLAGITRKIPGYGRLFQI
ncbi:ectoine utilization protein EutA [Sneathiella litorea]|uniref:Ectoine utilization protein EutA n=1 Tax=Sneathiella litorea TaxID=2606216 RepID=A0A6L8W981_9PROT|nr:ectoine utilization protein EutA [Sneathiella litorea]MZR31655.1 ectoine utilization protein EutA [Sneathiella litorea]